MTQLTAAPTAWPSLTLDSWRDTYATLHMWMQVVGKICLALTPLENHFWNVAFHLAPRGLATPSLRRGERYCGMEFDFIDHRLVIDCSDDGRDAIDLRPMPVAEFYHEVMEKLRRLGIEVRIWTMPVEIPDPVPFEKDFAHRSYDPERAHAFWRILATIEPVFRRLRAGFLGKCSPVHFFWGSFDLAVTRFSGRRAPERAGADAITREAYSHEVISHGFWPGSGDVPEAAFYAYAAPEPAGFREASVAPAAAFYHPAVSEFILPYKAVRAASSPETVLAEFLESTYEAGANLGAWNRAELERGRS
jgi:hypothetical protein